MYSHYALLDYDLHYRTSELLREAENDRLVDEALGPGRPVRRRVAEWLVSLAEWVDDQPRGTFASAEV